jgi:hypothetical protein
MAALVSALAAVLMVAVGPGLAEQPDDAGTPNENASAQATEAHADDPASSEESSDVAASDETTDETSDVAAVADEADSLPPGQEKKEEDSAGDESSTETDSAVAGVSTDSGPPGQAAKDGDPALGNSENSHNVNEDTTQTGLPRGQEADECTNTHHGDDNDFSGHGANQHGLYDNTCDGRASENGSGGGNATGRPCMGCVGNADDKNPNGQSPNHLGGKDHNAGYECDRNKGVGQGNPAHTDCQPDDIITICHSDDEGDTWSVITDTRDDIEDILAEDGPDFAFVVGAGTEAEDCQEPPCKHNCENEKVYICHATGSDTNPYVIVHVSKNAWVDDEGHSHSGHAGDFEVPAGTSAADCDDEQDEEVFVCHSEDGENWSVEGPMTPAEAQHDHLGPHHFDFLVDEDTDASDCEDEQDDTLSINASCSSVSATSTVDITNVTVRFQNGTSQTINGAGKTFSLHFNDDVESATVRAGSMSESDDVSGDCDTTRRDEDTICHSLNGTDWEVITDDENDIDDHLDDHPFDFPVARGFDVDDCDEEEQVCPEGTDLEGEAMPDDRECDIPPVQNQGRPLCPKGSDMAGLPVPQGVVANCWKDAVLPALIDRPANPAVLPGRIPGRPPTEQPGVLPFTGASVLAFLVLALQLIAAGTLILRGKKA